MQHPDEPGHARPRLQRIISAIRRAPSHPGPFDKLSRWGFRWLSRLSLGLTREEREDVVSEATAESIRQILDPALKVEVAASHFTTRLGANRRKTYSRKRHESRLFVPLSDESPLAPSGPSSTQADEVIRRDWATRLVRAAKNLYVLALDQLRTKDRDFLIEAYALGLEPCGAARLADKKPAAQRQALKRARDAFSRSLEEVLRSAADADVGLDRELALETVRFVCGEPLRLLATLRGPQPSSSKPGSNT
jgi:DNA-directed RNA polymerase specialized sigma24 family protein